MADLGALSLALGADLSPLEASLDRAEELVNRSAAQMQKSFGKPFKFKVEVGDLAVQLTQAEGIRDKLSFDRNCQAGLTINRSTNP